jgi:hypothetical protein
MHAKSKSQRARNTSISSEQLDGFGDDVLGEGEGTVFCVAVDLLWMEDAIPGLQAWCFA